MSRVGQIALITAGTAAAGLLGYCVYFDYMRRNSSEFRKGLRKQQKKLKEAAEARAKDQAIRDQRELTMALVELELEAPPASPEAMEAYFQEHVATAEALAAEGPDNYVKAATHFYRALRVYPQPVELLMIYQKVCPEPVFQLVIKLTQLTSAAVGAGAGGAAAPRAGAALEDIDDIDEAAEPKAAAAATVAATVADAEAKLEGAAAVEAAILESEVATKIEAVLEAAEEAIEEAIEEDEAAEAGAETEVEGEAEVASERAESNNGSGASWDHVEAQPQH